MVNGTEESVELDEESFDELYTKVRGMAWPSQRDHLYLLLIGALEEPLTAPRKPEAEELRRKLQADGFFDRLESACKLKFTTPWRKNLCLTIVSLQTMGPWDAGERAKSLKAVLRRADRFDQIALQIEESVEFRALAQGPYLPNEFSTVVRVPALLRQWGRLLRETIGTGVGKAKKETGQIALEYLTDVFQSAGGKVGGSWRGAYLDGPFMRFLKLMWEILPPDIRGATPEALAGRERRIRIKNRKLSKDL